MLAAEALAATPGVQRLVFGTIDFALDLDLAGDLASTIGLDHAASRLALASRAAGIAAPVAGVTTAIDDEALLLADLARARAHGFSAKLCIHPKQISSRSMPRWRRAPPSSPGPSACWPRPTLPAARAVQLDGRMVDKPVIERARRLVARATR